MAALLLLFNPDCFAVNQGARATDSLKYFYTQLKEEHCEGIQNYVLDYNENRCRSAKIKEYRLISSHNDSEGIVVAEYHIDGQSKEGDISGDYEIRLLQRGDQWFPDFKSIHKVKKDSQPHSQIKWIPIHPNSSDSKHMVGPDQTTDAEKSTTLQADDESIQPSSAVIPSDPRNRSSSVPPVNDQIGTITITKPTSQKNESSLLSLWSEAELAGTPSDLVIKTLSPPDLEAPTSQSSVPVSEKYPHLKSLSLRRFKYSGERKPVALTFDLCEQADEKTAYDSGIVDELRRTRTKATFYAGGKWMQSHQNRTMQLIADPLFEFGNHAWTHGNMRVLTGQAMEHQIDWAQAEYHRLRSELAEKATNGGLSQLMADVPESMTTFRFPYGTCNKKSLDALYVRNIVPIQWDVVTGDPGGIAAPENIIKQTRPGSIVVMHANGRGKGTSKALPEIIRGLKSQGFTFVKLSELLSDSQATPEYAEDCYELRPGDNVRYDKLFGDGLTRRKN